MENKLKDNVDQISQHAKATAPLALRWIKLKAVEAVSKVITSVLHTVVSIILIFFTMIMASFSLAFYVGNLYDSIAAGFLAITAFYVVIIILYKLFLGGILKRIVMGSIINKFLK